MWYNERKTRITASKAKRCLLKDSTSPSKAIQEVLMQKTAKQTTKMKEGIVMEPQIIKRFSEKTGHKITKCGFFISEKCPFLGASPDGITEEGNIIEVKKVTSKGNEDASDTLCRLGIYQRKGSDIFINKKHRYYHQIQQQLFCANKKLCHFIVSNGEWLKIEDIVFYQIFWNETVTKLENFYFSNIFPELVYPRLLHGQPRWNKIINFPRLE